MEFFKYDINAYYNVLNKKDLKPHYMVPNGIKVSFAKLKIAKGKIKKFILEYDTLPDFKKFNLIRSIYRFSAQKIADYQTGLIKADFPVEKAIKTNLYVPNNNHSVKALAIVQAKKGVKLSKFKTYTKQDLDTLVQNGDIVIVKAEPYGKYTNKPIETGFLHVESAIAPEFCLCREVTKQEFQNMQTKNPQLVELVMNDINIEQIKKEYQSIFLPNYKAYIKYLVECAKFSTQQKNKEEEQIQIKQREIDNQKTEYANVQKQLNDNSRGR